MTRRVHPVERESYAILRGRVDTAALPPWSRAVTERVVHATADPAWAADLACDEAALRAGAEALRAGAPLVCDVEMVAAGITARPATCRIRDPRAAEMAARTGLTRSAAAVRLAAAETGPGAVWAVGCAPTALAELLALAGSPDRTAVPAPALVIGLPVGFVGAAEAKAALRRSGLPALTNVSEKGGAAVAAAAVNALLYGLGER